MFSKTYYLTFHVGHSSHRRREIIKEGLGPFVGWVHHLVPRIESSLVGLEDLTLLHSRHRIINQFIWT